MQTNRILGWSSERVRLALRRRETIGRLVAVGLFALGCMAADAAGPAQRLIATVSAVDAHAGTLDVVTGVGYALRIVRLQIPAQLQVRTRSGTTPPSTLIPGNVVRVVYRATASGAVADSIELLPAPPGGEKR